MTRAFSGLSVLPLGALLCMVACGGGKFESGDGTGSGGSGADGSGADSGSSNNGSNSSNSGSNGSGSGGGSSSSASGSGGTSSGSSNSGSGNTSSGSGGTNSGSGGGVGTGGSGGSTVRGQCESAADCVAAADFGDPCYSEGCSLPVAASLSDLDQDSCLVPWEDRGDGRPGSCDVPDSMVVCPASCAQPPECIDVACHNQQCQVDFGYDQQSCSGSGGAGGTSGSGGTSSTGGSGGTSSTGGSAGTSSTGGNGGTGGTGPDCGALNEARQSALTDAVSCDPEVDGPQCTGEDTVPDQCGCPQLVNDADQEAVSKAQEAYDAWVNAGCGPYACGAACFTGETGQCGDATSTCSWLGL